MTTGAPLIGWAKPVPVDVRRLRRHRRDYMLVAAAGPASNLAIAVVSATLLAIMPISPHTLGETNVSAPLAAILTQLTRLNVLLAVFNMIPIPPLDGGNVLLGLLPLSLARFYNQLRPYGFLLIYALSLLGSSVSVMLFSGPFVPTIGASGAIYGLMGALLVTFKRLGYDLKQLLIVVAINIYITFQFPGISWQGHLGGLVVGAIVGAAMVYPPQESRKQWQWGTAIGVLVVLAALVVIRDGQLGEWFCVYAANGAGTCVPAH